MHSEEQLSVVEQGELGSLMLTRGFQALTKVMEQEVLRFREDLINTPTEDHAKVLANHQMAKASAMFYARLMQRLNRESEVTRVSQGQELWEDVLQENS
jgi:hypothetical protein